MVLLSNYTNMKANQFYRQWITDYRIEKNDRSGEPIQDGDLLDWLAEKFESGEFKQLNKPVVMQAGCNHMFVEARNIVLKDGFICVHCQEFRPASVGKAGEDASVSDGK